MSTTREERLLKKIIGKQNYLAADSFNKTEISTEAIEKAREYYRKHQAIPQINDFATPEVKNFEKERKEYHDYRRELLVNKLLKRERIKIRPPQKIVKLPPPDYSEWEEEVRKFEEEP